MDNLTHTLVGALVGEGIAHLSAARRSGLPHDGRRGLIIGSMVLGGNLPDLDFLYSAIYGGKLDYLLHHRGHTHTIIGALVASMLMWLALIAWMRVKRWSPNRSDRASILAAALAAPLLHIAMDFANNYGVHPFWPLDNRWRYGDSVFIIEPLLWAACAPLVAAVRSLAVRAAVLLVLATGSALAFFSGLVPAPNAIFLLALTLAVLAVARYARRSVALASGVGVWLATTLVFALSSQVAAEHVETAAARAFPHDMLLDRVVTPMPVNPLCWEVILIQERDARIVLRRGMLSIAPERIAAQRCLSRSLDDRTTAQLSPIARPDDAEIKWRGQTSYARSQLADLASRDCRVAAFLQFARAPFLMTTERTVIGDLRYDREPELGFAELDLDEGVECPAHVPPWLPPRADLLR